MFQNPNFGKAGLPISIVEGEVAFIAHLFTPRLQKLLRSSNHFFYPEIAKGRGLGWTGDQHSTQSICSLLLQEEELVPAALANCHKTFRGGRGHSQERLFPESASMARYRQEEGRKFEFCVFHSKTNAGPLVLIMPSCQALLHVL